MYGSVSFVSIRLGYRKMYLAKNIRTMKIKRRIVSMIFFDLFIVKRDLSKRYLYQGLRTYEECKPVSMN